MPARADVVHLLRRTEIVARPGRVAALEALPSLAAAVDDVLDVPADPGSLTFSASSEWERGLELQHFWLNRLAHDSPRPIQEQLAVFWHGHFVSSLDKVYLGHVMREQIDLWRAHGFGNVRDLAVTMSIQPAMLRYLDNNQNRKSSPNQNFGRELLELFLLGVGNYTERDVEASTAAWTGHSEYWENGAYQWHANWHDGSAKQFLGRTINVGGDPRLHGAEVIQTVLGNGVVPAGAANTGNRGRPTREVAAEFLSRKLWTFFAGTPPPAAVLTALREVLVANDFAVRPWVRALLLRPEFYTAEVTQGLLRSPTDYVVALLAATGLRSEQVTPFWLLEGAGQELLRPPNVSGWRNNAAYVSAGAFGTRAAIAQHFMWRTMRTFWDGGQIQLAGGAITHADLSGNVKTSAQRQAVADQIVSYMGLELSTGSRDALRQFAAGAVGWWQLPTLVQLTLITPEMHVS